MQSNCDIRTGRARLARQGTALALAIAASVAGPTQAGAQTLSNDSSTTEAASVSNQTWDSAKQYGAASVQEQHRKDYSPDGIRIRTFLAYPEIAVATTFDDNIVATPGGGRSDLRVDVSPRIQITSDMPRHQLSFGFGGRMSRYLNNSSLDHENGSAHLEGALHINQAHTVFARISTNYSHTDNFQHGLDSAVPGLTPVWANRATIGIVRDAGRLHGSLTASAEHWNFFDVDLPGGAALSQDQRDVAVYSSRLTTKYRFSPAFTGILTGRFVRQETSEQATPSGNLDSIGYEVMAGLSGELSPVLRASLLGGWAQRNYDRSEIENASSATYEASLQWLPTQIMTVKATARQGLNETPQQNIFGHVDTLPSMLTSFALDVDYEILRNLVLNIDGEYRILDTFYSGQKDEHYIARIGLDYFHAKNWLFQIAYEHQFRQSDAFPGDLTRNRIWASATLRF